MEMVEKYRHLKQVWLGLNATFITLIPKSQEAGSTSGFWTISLCNVICNILSSILVWRLKPILHHIISQEKSGFIEGE